MSETVYKAEVLGPKGYDKIDRFEIMKIDDGTLRTFGIIELGEGDESQEKKIVLPDISQLYGYDPKMERSARGVWELNGTETPIVVIGVAPTKDDETYYKIEGSETSIPASQIRWLKEGESIDEPATEDLPDDPEELKQIIRGLREEMRLMITESAAVIAEENRAMHDELRDAIADIPNAIKAALTERDISPIRSGSYVRVIGTDTVGRVERFDDDDGDEARAVVVDKEGEVIDIYPVKRLEIVSAPPPPPETDPRYPYKEPLLKKWNRRIRGDTTPSPEYVYVDERGRRYFVVDDERIYVEDNKKDKGGRILGAAALVLATGALLIAGCDALDDDDDGESKTVNRSEFNTYVNTDNDRDAEQAKEIDNLQNRVTDLEAENNDQEEEITDLEGQVDNLQDKVKNLRKELSGGGYSIPEAVNGSEVTVRSGYGYTQVIRDMFPGYSATAYLAAHQDAVDHFGKNYISGIPKYTIASGELRLGSTGTGVVKPSVRTHIFKFLRDNY